MFSRSSRCGAVTVCTSLVFLVGLQHRQAASEPRQKHVELLVNGDFEQGAGRSIRGWSFCREPYKGDLRWGVSTDAGDLPPCGAPGRSHERDGIHRNRRSCDGYPIR